MNSGRDWNLISVIWEYFGSLAYVNIPDQLRPKMDDIAETMVFVGYNLRSKANRLYDPATGKIVIRRDVVFDESKLSLLTCFLNQSITYRTVHARGR